MIVGVDASNLGSGGAIAHLTNLLACADPAADGIDRVVVWGGRSILEVLPRRDWLETAHDPILDRSVASRLRWQRRFLPSLAARRCDVLFAPGSLAPPVPLPLVVLSQNMLPFETRELLRYGASYPSIRLALLRLGQARTFRRADGMIFLSRYARDAILGRVRVRGRITVIPHGIEDRFRVAPRRPRPLADCSPVDPLRVLYVSIVDVYKHQWNVAEAMALLRREGLPVRAEFVGPAYPPALRRLVRTLDSLDPRREFVVRREGVPFSELHATYRHAEIFVFASSCENLPNILVEAMASGLPIACSSRGPMPEVLGDAGVYFDPEDPGSIASAVRALARDPDLRAEKAALAHARAAPYAWPRCASDTLAFIAQVGR